MLNSVTAHPSTLLRGKRALREQDEAGEAALNAQSGIQAKDRFGGSFDVKDQVVIYDV